MNTVQCSAEDSNDSMYINHYITLESCGHEDITINTTMMSKDQQAVSDAVMWSSVLIFSTVGTFLMVSLIRYERFEGDPQKRSLGNRLVSNNLCTILIVCWTRNAFILLARYRQLT